MVGQPYPLPVRSPDSIDLSVRVSNPGGGWIELNDHVLFTVAEGSFTGEAVTWRRKEDKPEFLEGSYLISALRENVMRPLNVYITGGSQYDTMVARHKMEELFSQRSFQMVRTVENASVLWQCQTSDWTMESDRPLLHAKKVLMRIQVPCHPDETYAEEI